MNSPSKKYFLTWIVVAITAVFATPLLASHPYAQWAEEFGIDLNASYDGTRVMEMKDGTFEFVEHKAPGKMYTEVNMGGMTSGILLREDLGKSYVLMPSMGSYMETSISDALTQSSNGLIFHSIEEIGYDTILGYPCVKYAVRFEDKDGKGAGHTWVTDTGVPVKMDMIYSSEEVKGLRLTMEFVELNMRDQDPAIFELDPNLKPMALAGFSGMMGQGGQPGAAGVDSTAMAEEMLIQMAPGGPLGSAAADAGLESIGGLDGLKGLIPGMSQEPAAAPAGSSGGAVTPSSSMSTQLTTDNMTQSVQLHLQYLGIDPGNTSGDMSLDTQIAISEFQATKGMQVTGEVSPQLLGVLAAEVDSE